MENIPTRAAQTIGQLYPGEESLESPLQASLTNLNRISSRNTQIIQNIPTQQVQANQQFYTQPQYMVQPIQYQSSNVPQYQFIVNQAQTTTLRQNQPMQVPVQVQQIPFQQLSVQQIPVQVQQIPIQVQQVPVQTVPVQTVPVQTVPVQTVPVQTVPVQTVPVQMQVNQIPSKIYSIVDEHNLFKDDEYFLRQQKRKQEMRKLLEYDDCYYANCRHRPFYDYYNPRQRYFDEPHYPPHGYRESFYRPEYEASQLYRERPTGYAPRAYDQLSRSRPEWRPDWRSDWRPEWKERDYRPYENLRNQAIKREDLEPRNQQWN